jgi:hypothetical protein
MARLDSHLLVRRRSPPHIARSEIDPVPSHLIGWVPGRNTFAAFNPWAGFWPPDRPVGDPLAPGLGCYNPMAEYATKHEVEQIVNAAVSKAVDARK